MKKWKAVEEREAEEKQAVDGAKKRKRVEGKAATEAEKNAWAARQVYEIEDEDTTADELPRIGAFPSTQTEPRGSTLGQLLAPSRYPGKKASEVGRRNAKT